MIPYGHQSINESDIRAVCQVLQSDWLTQGPALERFEQAVATYCGARFAVAVSSATAALHIACLAAGLGPGDLLWTSPNTFVASANCGLYCGAQVDFVDIDPRTYNLSTEALKFKLGNAKTSGHLPKVVVPVDFAGQSCEMKTIAQLAHKYEFTVIEDASHAIGGLYRGKRIGAGTYADMAVFSFHPVKIITSGEGGMVLTNRQDLYEKLIRLRCHGTTHDPRQMDGESDGPWYYQQIELGFNYRMTDIQAALGASQLERIEDFLARRRELAARYFKLLADLPLVLPYQHPDTVSSFHLFVIRLQLNRIDQNRRQIFEAMRSQGIGVNVHYIPVHTQPYYRRLGFKQGDFPESERYYDEAITLPLYFGLTNEDQEQVVEVLRNLIGKGAAQRRRIG